ncbi:tetratricopeptide repeat protein [Paractinoplanes rishiriensis]|uniref:tetratricopeptide repeat protein n=1 Tax=Paractinoplanes rishiriensis TaxID=1050105 RepID=UPI001942E862|nr:tetratricopeptide repeat protein [Actinoplanes rishiriensis]
MARGTSRFNAAEFRRRRLATGLSQQRVAEAVGTTRQQIIAYERGRAAPEPARLATLAAAIGCAPGVLTAAPEPADLAGLRRAAGMTRTQAVARLAGALGDRVPATRWLLEQAETANVPAAWRSTSRRAAVVAAMARTYGVPVEVVARLWPRPAAGAVRAPADDTGLRTPDPRHTLVAPPDPGSATTLDGLLERLRMLKVWAGDPSYGDIRTRVGKAWSAAGRPATELPGRTTVLDCFRTDRRRVNAELIVAIVQTLHPDVGYVAQWRQALRVIGAESTAAAQVRVQDRLPPELARFTGRTAEVEWIRRELGDDRRDRGPVVISAIEGMAGIGKTQLAVHAGHLVLRERSVDQVLFVNLRGFHPDAGQPPADPAAVLEGFLRLLGETGQQIPHDLEGRAARYRDLLAGRRVLVVLDNAAGADQVRPLLPRDGNSPALITSRRALADLRSATHLALDVFTPGEAVEFLARATPRLPAGDDSTAAARIADRCGHLPLALGLVAGHIQAKPDWSLTDHADWLDERHHQRRLDTGVELALNLSYQHLPPDRRRLLRLLALHPGHDLDAHAAAALAGTDPDTARTHLGLLHGDHLLQQASLGRYTFHDLVRAYATTLAHDQDRPSQRRAALTRLFDHYLAAAAAAMGTLHPTESRPQPHPPSAGTPDPDLADPAAALGWLDTERPNLVAVAVHAATHGWPAHSTRLARILHTYLDGGHYTDGLTVHTHARRAARDNGDPAGQAHALNSLGLAYQRLGRPEPATEHFEQALELFQQVRDPAGEARARNHLGNAAVRAGDYREATDQFTRALDLDRQSGDQIGEARTLNNLGNVHWRLCRYQEAVNYDNQSLFLFRQAGDLFGEASTLDSLGYAEMRWGRYEDAGRHLRQSLALFRKLGNHTGEASVLDSLGSIETRLGRPDRAVDLHQRALTVLREAHHRFGQVWALNGLGEAAHAAGRHAEAVGHHTDALAVDVCDRQQQARAHTGLGHAHLSLGHPDLAREHYERALTLYINLGTPEADEVRVLLRRLD